jgi:hypothetical protein
VTLLKTNDPAAVHSTELASCTSCDGQNLTPFYSVAATPVTCASVFESAALAQAVPVGRVELSVCHACGLIFNTMFDEKLADIGARYESAQGASAHFSQFAQSLSKGWIQDHQLQGQTVIEIGCGDGAFLKLMLTHGVASAVGFDPVTIAQEHSAAHPTLSLRAQRFDATTLQVAGQAAVCRHTLEHVADVSGFLRLLAQWARQAPGRAVLFEVPAIERVLTEFAFWDVYYEHCSYFTAASLRHAFEQAGFEVTRLEPVYNDQYLVLEAAAVPELTPRLLNAARLDALHTACLQFANQARQAIANCNQGLQALAAHGGGPVVLWQGASKTVGFLSALSSTELIHSAVDLSPQRWGQFLPGSGLPIYPPAQLQSIQPAHVVLMNPVYFDEVQAHLTQMGVGARLLTVNDLCSGKATAMF